MERDFISVVIPVYQCSDSLEELCRRLLPILDDLQVDSEIIMVVDGSPDNSWEVLQTLASSDNRIKAIKLSRNFGQHNAVSAGLDYAEGTWTIIMDCDLQDRPEEIPKLFAKAREGFDVVLARRGKRKDTKFKKFSNFVFYKIFNFLTGMKYDPQVGAFRIISNKVVKNYRKFNEQTRFFNGLIEWMGFSTAYVDVEHGSRFCGETSYTFWKLLKFSANIIIAHSDKPLRMSVMFGFAMSTFSLFAGIYVTYLSFVQNITISGWASLIISMYFLAGIIMVNLGILGIYLGKVFEETKDRPLYIVDRAIGLEEKTAVTI